MSTTTLPGYNEPLFNRTPSYSAEPGQHEQRIALSDRLRPRPSGEFVKQSKSGDVSLRLVAQEDNVSLPVYGNGGCVEGTVNVSKTEGITSIEVKIEGRLRLKEIAEGGTTSVKLCLDTALLWIKDPSNSTCPPTLRFRLNLPSTFAIEGKNYPLPPTYSVQLAGVPGFTADIDYSVSALVIRSGFNVPLVKSSIFGMSSGNITVSTPFIYYPRTRPAVPLPSPMILGKDGLVDRLGWRCFQSSMAAKHSGGQDIITKLYIPASRIFAISQPIPFHLAFESSAFSLAAFLPFGPGTNITKRPTRIQLMRQSTVDVRNSVIYGTKTDIWRVDCIGQGTFKFAGDGPNWISFRGEITINEDVKVAGFKASGLTVKDCIVLSMNPPDPTKSPFNELRQLVPVRLTTDVFTTDGTGLGVPSRISGSDYSDVDEPPPLAYNDHTS